jgi:hypothetical protein
MEDGVMIVTLTVDMEFNVPANEEDAAAEIAFTELESIMSHYPSVLWLVQSEQVREVDNDD